ncbi:MAG: carboxypeptidase regulatory-like domain-containing protein, partial [Acidobacteriia bacterium]|nr:carboxypeptidase regulatory-like domain-containing protein [Terriglobia bacterium]
MTTLLGQGTTGTITGVITDPSGAVVPGATVTILNERTGVDFHLTTNSAGIYSITSLLPSLYTVKVEAKGFRTHINRDIELTTDQVLRLDLTMEVGAETQTITVEAVAPLVNTEEGRLSAVVTGSQVQNMPLNGRNIYDLMQLVPGAINSTGVNLENASAGGSATNINGNRLNFNQFQLDGVDNTGLTGGSDAQPSPDFISEFRIMTNNFSAEYGAAGGSVTDVSIKTGTNQFHGNAWEYFRNDALNARNFFSGSKKDPWRQNQFGADLGGPIKKDKLFFFGGYEAERFRTNSPQQYLTETPAFRQAVTTASPNSVAAALYKAYPGPNPTQDFSTVDDVINSQAANDIAAPVGDSAGYADGTFLPNAYTAYTDPCFLNQWNLIGAPAYPGGPPLNGSPQNVANTMGALVGVTQAEHDQIQTNIGAACPPSMGLVAPAVQAGAIARDTPMLGLVNYSVPTRTVGEFYNGDQFAGRVDYQGDKNRVFGRMYYLLQKDPNNTTATSQVRGFYVPFTASFPGGAFGFVHNFSGNVVNEFRAGYIRNQLSLVPAKPTNGVPTIGFDTGDVQFGAYNGYPQFFNENVYNYSDMLAVVKGKHSLKIGASYKRNQENSEFNVGRPSYYFFDQFYFAASAPYIVAAGVNP